MRGSLFQITTFIELDANWAEKAKLSPLEEAFPITM
jgi:hypothetical protein